MQMTTNSCSFVQKNLSKSRSHFAKL